ncbi:MAG: hypothetical protein EGQ21_07060 [Akkermansia sp.]|nr:hypothetical protein [Akkermansia sp.]
MNGDFSLHSGIMGLLHPGIPTGMCLLSKIRASIFLTVSLGATTGLTLTRSEWSLCGSQQTVLLSRNRHIPFLLTKQLDECHHLRKDTINTKGFIIIMNL